MVIKYTSRPNRETLYRLYVDEFNTAQQIADIYSVSETTVYNWLASAYIKRRTLSAAQLKHKRVPTSDELCKLYNDDLMTMVDIAHKYGVSDFTVRRWLRKAGIKIKTPSEIWLKGKSVPTQNELYEMYIADGMSVLEVSKAFGIGKTTVGRLLEKYGIPTRGMEEVKLCGKRRPSPEEILDLYVTKCIPATKIGGMFGVMHGTVGKWVVAAGGKMRTASECNMIGKQKPSDKELYDLYITEGKTALLIGKMFDVSPTTITSWLHDSNIRVRTISEVRLYGKIPPTHEELYDLYIVQLKSSNEIGRMFGISGNAITDYLRDAGIDVRVSGDTYTGNWKGGISKSPYCYKWTEELRESIRDRFGRKCFICGMGELENGKKLSVHHTDSGKMCMCDYSCELVPLCSRCHGKTVHNRFYWYSLIMCKLLLESSAQFLNMVHCI